MQINTPVLATGNTVQIQISNESIIIYRYSIFISQVKQYLLINNFLLGTQYRGRNFFVYSKNPTFSIIENG